MTPNREKPKEEEKEAVVLCTRSAGNSEASLNLKNKESKKRFLFVL